MTSGIELGRREVAVVLNVGVEAVINHAHDRAECIALLAAVEDGATGFRVLPSTRMNEAAVVTPMSDEDRDSCVDEPACNVERLLLSRDAAEMVPLASGQPSPG